MRLPPRSLAISALLGASASTRIQSTGSTSCDLEALSNDVRVSGNNLSEEMNSTFQKACITWLQTGDHSGTFDNPLFKLIYTGIIGNSNGETCADALATIIEGCRSEAFYYGGSTAFQGVNYKITKTASDLEKKLEARAGKGTLPTSKTGGSIPPKSSSSFKGASATKGSPASATKSASPTKNSSSVKSVPSPKVSSTAKVASPMIASSIKTSSTKNTSSTNQSPTNVSSTKSGSSAKAASFTHGASSSKGSSPKSVSSSSSSTPSGKACKAKSSIATPGSTKARPKSTATPKSGPVTKPLSKKSDTVRELSGRAILLDLIRHSSRSLLQRNSKTVNLCAKQLAANNYPSGSQLVKKNPAVTIFGFDQKKMLNWNEGPANEVGDVSRGDTEHVLEWQTVASFFDKYLDKKIPVCTTILEFLGNTPPELEIEKDAPEKGQLKMPFAGLLADVYPSTTKNSEELVILDYKPNEVVKMHMFTNMDVVSEGTFGAKKDHSKALTYLRDALAVGLYFKNKEVINIFKKQKTRMATRIGKVGDAMKCYQPKFNEAGLDLKQEWDTYMDQTWAAAAAKLQIWMSEKTKWMNDILKCQELKKESKETKETKETDQTKRTDQTKKTEKTEQMKNCEILSFIEKTWAEVVAGDTFKNAPWKNPAGGESSGKNSGESSEGDGKQPTGQKRPALESPPGSDIWKPEPKVGKPSEKKGSSSSSN